METTFKSHQLLPIFGTSFQDGLTADRVSGVGDKLLDVLEVVSANGPNANLSKIAAEAGLTKSTALRLLRLLQRRGYIKRGHEDTYCAGEVNLINAHHALVSSSLRALALPLLINLCVAFDQAANLNIPLWPDILYLERIIPSKLHAVLGPPGKLIPFHATASGKVIVSFQSDSLIESLLKRPLVSYTKETKTDPAMLRQEFEEIRDLGWARDVGELRHDVRCIAAPVRARDGQVMASVGLTSVGVQYVDEVKVLQAVVDAARSLSGLLGYS